MRDTLKRLAAFTICVVAALPVRSAVKVTDLSLAPWPEPPGAEIVLAPQPAGVGAEAVPSPAAENPEAGPQLTVRVTAYAAVPQCTKKINPDITASGRKITRKDHYRLIALSPDIARKFKFGDRFRLDVGKKRFYVRFDDMMPDRHREAIDFLLPSVKRCNDFGVQTGKITFLRPWRAGDR